MTDLLYTAALPIDEIVFCLMQNRKPKVFVLTLGFYKRLKVKIKQGTARSHHFVQVFGIDQCLHFLLGNFTLPKASYVLTIVVTS